MSTQSTHETVEYRVDMMTVSGWDIHTFRNEDEAVAYARFQGSDSRYRRVVVTKNTTTTTVTIEVDTQVLEVVK